MRFAEVAIDVPGGAPHLFTYSIPDGLTVRPGHAVRVPFGRQARQGVIAALSDSPPADVMETRPLLDLIDPEPVVSPLHLELAQWISEHYRCSLYQALKPMLPPAFERGQVVSYAIQDNIDRSPLRLTQLEEQALLLLREHGTMTSQALRQTLGSGAARALAALERAGLVRREAAWARPRIAPRVETWVELAVSAEEARAEARRLREPAEALRRADALELLARLAEPIALAEARRISGVSTPSWEALGRAGLVRIEQREVRRDPLASLRGHVTAPPELTPHQQAAVEEIRHALEAGQGSVFLLHGVTGSGKTEVYLRALERAVALGKRGIVLVPEIALTAQTVERFWGRFPGRVAVLHSGLSLREHYDEWRSIRDGRFDVVIGSRGAILAPQPDVGLIVVDEEQEWTYKQEEQAPRYHARDVAVEMARRAGAVAILGSATPDIETMYRALRKTYRLVELPGRIVTGQDGAGYRERPLAQVEVVDLRDELRAGNRSIFSRALTGALGAALDAGEQAILFVNRRGAGSAVQCRACGHTVQCRRCSIALTYHAEGVLLCHHCGRRRASPERCPACGRRTIRALGIGTERVAQEAMGAFPGARVLRWDQDAVREAGGHEAILSAFLRHEADILVGTQMLAKGLDLPRVTVVGVVIADIGLHVPDFRAGERAFQVLCQVAGRAGRGFAPGRVIVQTYEPDHYAIRTAADQDYRQFYLEELSFRRALDYPPFTRMARLLYADASPRAARQEADRVAVLLGEEVRRRGMEGMRLIGPAPAPLERLRGRYRWQLEVLGPDPVALLSVVVLPPRWAVDVDPVNTL